MYKELIETMIKTELRIVGKVAIRVANDSGLIEVSDNGDVKSLKDDPKKVFLEIYNLYKNLGFGLASAVIKKAITPIIKNHPELEIPEELR